jgi:hypothetical protein
VVHAQVDGQLEEDVLAVDASAPIDRHLVKVDFGAQLREDELTEELALLLAVHRQQWKLGAHSLGDERLLWSQLDHTCNRDRLDCSTELCRVERHSVERLVCLRVVAGVGPLGKDEHAMIRADERLQIVDVPSGVHAEHGEARSQPLRDAMVVAVPVRLQQTASHVDTRGRRANRGHQPLVVGLRMVGAAAAVFEDEA